MCIEEGQQMFPDAPEIVSGNKPPDEQVVSVRVADNFSPAQWRVENEDNFQPCGKTILRLPSANYWPQVNRDGTVSFSRRTIIGDKIVDIPDCASAQVLQRMEKFWNSRHRYKRYGLVYKRGILLYGPPGSGKTITVRQVCQQVLDRDGIVLHDQHPGFITQMLAMIRHIEPLRPVVVVHEDIDEIIRNHGESNLLSLLDGQEQVDNVVHVATTNYPERLGARIVNRPSRFDDRIEVPMPTESQRLCYLRSAFGHDGEVSESLLNKWAADTEDLSIAHMRELVTAVHCLEANYEETLQRLKDLYIRPESGENEGFKSKSRIGVR